MKKLTVLVLFVAVFTGFFASLLSCQSDQVEGPELVGGLIADEEGDLHLPLDFAERFPLLSDSNARANRMAWFNERSLGLYLDFGLHTFIGNEFQGKSVNDTEWLMCLAAISPADYEAEAQKFSLNELSVEKYLRWVESVGAEYVVLNAKHHDGFSMFDSDFTEYDIMDAPEKGRDFYSELVPALKAKGIKVGFHYSILDWHHPSQANMSEEGVKQHVDLQTDVTDEEKAAYTEYMSSQIRELVTRYSADLIWFNGDWVKWWTTEDGWKLQEEILEMNPNVIVNSRVGGQTAFDGDFNSFDQRHPLKLSKLNRSWETLFQLDLRYGINVKERILHYKLLTRNYINAVSRGGNLLVKASLQQDGNVNEKLLNVVGKMDNWLGDNRALLTDERVAPYQFWPTGLGVVFKDWRRFVIKDDTLYLFPFFNPGRDKIKIPEMKGMKYSNARFVGAEELAIEIEGQDDLLEDRAEALEDGDVEVQDSLEADPVPGDGVYFNIAAENEIFGYETVSFEKFDYETVSLNQDQWPEKKGLVVIAVDFEPISDAQLIAQYGQGAKAEAELAAVEEDTEDDDDVDLDDSDDDTEIN